MFDNKILPGQEKGEGLCLKKRKRENQSDGYERREVRCGGEEMHTGKFTHNLGSFANIFKPSTSALLFTKEPDVRETHQRG